MRHVVIIGGGFGGIYSTKHLLKNPNLKVTLISKVNYFLFTPLLHEVTVGSVNRHNIVEPIRDLFKSKKFSFIRSSVNKIDTRNNTIYFNNKKLNYDFLVIAIGSKPNYYNVPGAEEFSLPIKTIHDSIKIRNSILNSLENSYPNFVIIGAGATGVELAGDIADFVNENKRKYNVKKPNIYLIQAADKILPNSNLHKESINLLLNKKIKVLLDSTVTKITKNKVLINNNRTINASTIIWTGGVTPNYIKTIPRLQDKNNFFLIDNYLKINKNVYAIGDCSFNKNNPTPFLAQTAIQQAKIVSNNIIQSIKKKPLQKFKFNNKGFIVSIGKREAIGEINYPIKMKIKGMIAWVIKRHIYLSNIIGLQNNRYNDSNRGRKCR